jgi:hypothetical protein
VTCVICECEIHLSESVNLRDGAHLSAYDCAARLRAAHDRRVTELIEACNAEVEKRRAADLGHAATRLQLEAMTAQNLAMREQAVELRTQLVATEARERALREALEHTMDALPTVIKGRTIWGADGDEDEGAYVEHDWVKRARTALAATACSKCGGSGYIQGRPTQYETDTAEEREDARLMARQKCECQSKSQTAAQKCALCDKTATWNADNIHFCDKHFEPLRKAASPTPDAPEFDDDRVRIVYELLCSSDAPPPSEHWEGWTARRIVAALCPTPDAELQRRKAEAFDVLLAHAIYNTVDKTWRAEWRGPAPNSQRPTCLDHVTAIEAAKAAEGGK